MSNENMKKVIVLKNVYSKVFEEVIFVMKKDGAISKVSNTDLVSEAKKIIEDFVNRTDHNFDKKNNYQIAKQSNELVGYEKGKKLNILLNASLIVASLLFITLLIKAFG